MRTLTRMAVWTLTAVCLAVPVHAQTSGSILPDVVYGHKDGMALTFDVFTPAASNGVGSVDVHLRARKSEQWSRHRPGLGLF